MGTLTSFGSCDIAVNGKEAVEAFKAAHEKGEPYSLLCLDIMMPEMDGQDVLQIVRQTENKMSIPLDERTRIIMISALQDKRNIQQSFRNGCDSYIVKPITADILEEEILKTGIMPS